MLGKPRQPGCAAIDVTAVVACLVLAVFGTNAPGESISLSDNLASSLEKGVGITDARWIAQGFATTSDAYVITSITVPLAQADATSGTLTLCIYDATGQNGRPGSQVGDVVGTIEYSALPASPTFSQITFGGDVSLGKSLAPSASYYLVMKGSGVVGGTFEWGYTASASGIGFPSAYTYSDDAGASWALPDNTQPQQMRIEAAVVPEPGTSAMVLAGLGCGTLLLRRRSREVGSRPAGAPS